MGPKRFELPLELVEPILDGGGGALVLMVLDQEVHESGQRFGLIFGEGGGLGEQLSQAVGIALFEEMDNGRGGGRGGMTIVGGFDPVALALEGVGGKDEAAAGKITVKTGPVDGRSRRHRGRPGCEACCSQSERPLRREGRQRRS